jgi:hypothetical protein
MRKSLLPGQKVAVSNGVVVSKETLIVNERIKPWRLIMFIDASFPRTYILRDAYIFQAYGRHGLDQDPRP